jgi:hypothetical protein
MRDLKSRLTIPQLQAANMQKQKPRVFRPISGRRLPSRLKNKTVAEAVLRNRSPFITYLGYRASFASKKKE